MSLSPKSEWHDDQRRLLYCKVYKRRVRALDEPEQCVVLARLSVPVGAHANWPVDKRSGLENWRDTRAPKIECIRTGAQVCVHE